jgi:hypothetical protein
MITTKTWRDICEIGASRGESTDCLLTLPDVAVTVVDPCLDLDLKARYANDVRVQVWKGNSLDVLPVLNSSYDCILIDGDHNWYTVYNELRHITERELLRRGGMVFLHDVEWPYGRRDMYYQPDTIPPEYRHGYAQKGIVRGCSGLSDDSQFNSDFYNAVEEGGSRNGVLTAIEDFLCRYQGEYRFFRIRGQFGLGVIHYRDNRSKDSAVTLFVLHAMVHNLITWPERIAKTHLPSVYSLLKVALRRA